jgi:geranylgeranyl pyrophosphate synthase
MNLQTKGIEKEPMMKVSDVNDLVASIEQELNRAIDSRVNLLAEASGHIIRAGGKRIRPQVVLLAYTAAGGQDTSCVIPLAAAMEMIHTASLIHDDINDCSSLRRGHQTVNARWGNTAALLTGDFVFGKLMKHIGSFDARIIQVLADACVSIVEGETRQMLTLGDIYMAEETYLEIVRQKTASLFAASAEAGAIMAQATEQQISALAEYGLNLGMAFQIKDDALDYVGGSDRLGKPVALDLTQQKMSLPVIAALGKTDRLESALRAQNAPEVVQLLQETGALAYAMDQAQAYARKAQAALSALLHSEARTALYQMADFAIARDA